MIAREGSTPIAAAGASALAATYFLGLAWPTAVAWLVLAAVVWLYFEPRPECPPLPNAIIAPLTGTVSRVDQCWDPWSNRNSLRIRVEVPLTWVGVIWSPTEGKIVDFWTKGAVFDGPPGAPEDDTSPNCYALLLRTDEEQDVLVTLSSERPISRLKLDVGPGNRAGQGRRLGFAYFLSYADLLMDPNSDVEVSVGQSVVAGESVLASFPARA